MEPIKPFAMMVVTFLTGLWPFTILFFIIFVFCVISNILNIFNSNRN